MTEQSKNKWFGRVVFFGASVAFLAAATGCAQNGCDNIKGKYRAIYEPSAGSCGGAMEGIVDLDGTGSASAMPGCTARQSQTEDTDSCKIDTIESCTDGRRSTGIIKCEDDGEKCSIVLSVTDRSGNTCIYDGWLTRL